MKTSTKIQSTATFIDVELLSQQVAGSRRQKNIGHNMIQMVWPHVKCYLILESDGC